MMSRSASRLGFFDPIFAEQAPNFRDCGRRSRIDAIASCSGPHRVFIELKMLFSNAAEDHRSHAAVPQRERFHPLCCWLAVPDYVFLSGVPLRGRGGERGWHGGKEFSSVERHAVFSVWRKFCPFGRTFAAPLGRPNLPHVLF